MPISFAWCSMISIAHGNLCSWIQNTSKVLGLCVAEAGCNLWSGNAIRLVSRAQSNLRPCGRMHRFSRFDQHELSVFDAVQFLIRLTASLPPRPIATKCNVPHPGLNDSLLLTQQKWGLEAILDVGVNPWVPLLAFSLALHADSHLSPRCMSTANG